MWTVEMISITKINDFSSQSFIPHFEMQKAYTPDEGFVWLRALAPVVQKVDSAIHWLNHYPADKCYQN